MDTGNPQDAVALQLNEAFVLQDPDVEFIREISDGPTEVGGDDVVTEIDDMTY